MKRLFTYIMPVLFLSLLFSFSGDKDQLLFESKSVTARPKTSDSKEKIEHVFKFKNQSKESVLIEEVRPSCTCTTPGYTKESVKPGSDGFVKLSTTAEQLKKAGKVEAVIKTIDNKLVKKYYLLELSYGK
ncbi:DUF1573 domain-containing protein [Niabella sp. CJ426]|uniref:DUF1573 domain-containing protein n=1 Tax=Niabella sp. CJ426 TaxID=3393740 RepID=UPI003CFD2C84